MLVPVVASVSWAIDDASGVMSCCWLTSHDQNSHVAPYFSILTSGMQWCYWRCYWCHVMLTSMPVAWCETDTDANGVIWSKSHVCIAFNLHNQRNSMVLFMLTASCDANANGSTWPKKSCCTSFWLSWPKEFSGVTYQAISLYVLPILMPVVSYEQKCYVAPYFDHLDLMTAVVPLMILSATHDTDTDASGITRPKR